MFGSDYWKRIHPQRLCLYLRNGDYLERIDEGTHHERHDRYRADLAEALGLFRDRVADFDWSTAQGETEKEMKTEDMYQEVMAAIEGKTRLEYEMGFLTGLTIAYQRWSGL